VVLPQRGAPLSPLATVGAVCIFWWLATGLAFAMRADERARDIGALAATVLAGIGVWLIATSRRSRTPGAVLAAFLGGALLWGWVSVLFFGGWTTGLAPVTPAGAAGSLPRAVQAIGATLYSDLLGLAVVAGVAIATFRAPNRTALQTLAVFWVSHQLARINVFAGVPQPGADLLPDRLAYLQMFFGPPHQSMLLYASIVAAAAATAYFGSQAARAVDAYGRHRLVALATLAGLATFEYVALAVPAALPLWSAFQPHP
jgi:putative photosynthetic complex assembly protein 2